MSEGSRKAMEREDQSLLDFRTSVAEQALLPRDLPMRTLSSGHHVLLGSVDQFRRRLGFQSHHDCFGADHFEPVPPNLAAWPITPQNRVDRKSFDQVRARLRWTENWRGCGERPENGIDPSRFDAGFAFLTLRSQFARTTIADAGSLQQPVRAIVLRPAFLWVERVIGGAEQTAIRLRSKS
ncbi:hypothetical protein [Ktedonobacter sp. SOSP1-52]|uniref:hypothetical protein n=1 Tax=Ktedonobacter sp. SOSP1-52 TaxID=2778366 RepID=UPI00191569B0|nr:hypothetical protein [Ktedonobacter sp. SOSP1-52]